MTVSVVMATYNGEKYIKEQMDSILTQELAADEVIICDDCSTDSTALTVCEYIEKNALKNKWHFIKNSSNIGYAGNFKQAVSMATGDYIFFSDQDDIWTTDKIKRMVAVMEEHLDCNLLSTDYEPFSSEEYAFTVPEKIRKRMTGSGELTHLVLSDTSIYLETLGCCMCVRKTFRDFLTKYDFEGWAHDDRYWRLALCSGGSYILHSNLTRHRIHDHNTATYGNYHCKEKRLKNYRDTKNACYEMIRLMQDENKNETEIKLVRKHFKAMSMRINLIEKKHFWNALPLIIYLPHYYTKKSWLVDFAVMLRG